MISLLSYVIAACTPIAIDGDTIKLPCTGERIRLMAIDTPEMRGPSRVSGDPVAARDFLRSRIANGVRIRRFSRDIYGRTVAMVRDADGRDLSCLQLSLGHAVYWRRYDVGGVVRRECSTLAR
jgi:micrococcal nuclease